MRILKEAEPRILDSIADEYAKANKVKYKKHFIGSSYIVNRKLVTIKNVDSKNHKYPIIVTSTEDQRDYKLSWDMIKSGTLA